MLDMSIRAAIDRILQLPDLVGAQAVTHKDTVPCGGARTANDSSDEYGTNDQDSPFDTEHLQRPENNNTDEGMASRNFRDSGYTERRNSKAPFSTQSPLCAQSNQFSPLPRSSPFTTDSSFMDVDRDMILEFESSPRPPPSPITEWSNEQSMMFGHYLPATQHMHPSKDSGHGSDLGHFQPLSRISTSSDKFSGSKIHSSPELSPSFLSHQPTFRGLEFSDSPDRVRCIHETQPVKDNSDIVPMTHLPLDFLSDPDPWATIGRILQVERLKVTSDVTSSSECPIDFTKGREGVGYSVKTGRDVTSSMFTGAVSDSSPKETAVGSNQYFGDNDCSLSRTASRFGSAHKPLEDALAHDLNTFDDDVKLSSRLRRWPPYLEKNGPTEGDGARMMGGHLLTELECRTSDAFPEKNAAMVYDGPCLFGDSDSEDD